MPSLNHFRYQLQIKIGSLELAVLPSYSLRETMPGFGHP